MEIRGRSVLLTGATGGLGTAIARRLHREGASLILSGRNEARLAPLAAELGAVAAPCDLTDRSALNALLDEHGSVDILIANAGVPASGAVGSFDESEIDRIVEANLTAPIQMARRVVPGMVERGRGHVVLMSSLSGKVASPGSAMYCATKFGLRGFGLCLRQDLAPHGVGVSIVAPGFISDAGMFAKSGAELPTGVGTSTPEAVAETTYDVIVKNKAEVTVAPAMMRVGALLGSALPTISAKTQKASGAYEMSEKIAAGQADWRS